MNLLMLIMFGVSVALHNTTALAIILVESEFNAHAKNPNSSAYGYAQALDGTWADYAANKLVVGSRNELISSVRFINWHVKKYTKSNNLYIKYVLGPNHKITGKEPKWLVNKSKYVHDLQRNPHTLMHEILLKLTH